jgi:trimeric autotransporter adhesin
MHTPSHRPLPPRWSLLTWAVLGLATPLAPSALAQNQTPAQTPAAAAAAHPSRAYWVDQRRTANAALRSASGAERVVQAQRFRALALDRAGLSGLLESAPREFSSAARLNPLVISLPDPAGGFQRFRVVDAPVIEPGLAARHPHIRSYAGRGVDDPTATLRLSVTQLGVHASVRARRGNWYVEPLFQGDESLYASYWRSEVPRRVSRFAEPPMLQPMLSLQRGRYRAGDTVQLMGAGFVPFASVGISITAAGEAAPRQTLVATADAEGVLKAQFKAEPWQATGHFEISASDGRASGRSNYQVVPEGQPLNAAVGTQLRTYRLAMVTDPAYAAFHGAANVTAAKVVLMTRVNQVYEDDLSIRMVLIAATDALNLNTAAEATGANGPCGGAACFSASQLAGCSGSGLNQNRIVAGLLAGAGNFDVGHLALGGDGGGIAGLGVVGLDGKARGCTGINPPTGDVWAIDFVAHELGHQYAGNHTFNGVTGNCSGANRNAANSVEPGSGSSVMAYAGICGTDNVQLNSDPYFSQRSFDEVFNHVNAAELNLNELQQAALRLFNTNGQQFQLRWAGVESVPVVRGGNYTTAGIKAAIESIAGWPAGGTVTISSLTDNGFGISFGGTLALTDVANLELVNCTGGCSGFVSDITKGGASTRRGAVSATGNNPPVVTVPAAFTIPVRTPFALTGSATDPDGDTLSYLWEQNDRGGTAGTSLISNTKTNGPLFRQFGTRASFDASIYNPPGQNQAGGDPTRVFPDLLQLLANNTNAESGGCGTVSGSPTPAQLDCFSEFLPTADYLGLAGFNASPARLNMRLTVRDGLGGVNSADTVLTLAPGAGPFLVTAPNSAVTLDGAEPTTVTWAVANTQAPPVSTANVRVLLSTDGGLTWPRVLAPSVPNSGSATVTVPNLGSTQARVRVEAVGNVFFDVSNSNFTIRFTGDTDGNGLINCLDVNAVRKALGTVAGGPGYDIRLDFVPDGRIDALDIGYVSKRLDAGVSCSTTRRP